MGRRVSAKRTIGLVGGTTLAPPQPGSQTQESLGSKIRQGAGIISHCTRRVRIRHDMDSTVSWPPLGEMLTNDERLRLGSG